MQIYNVGPFEYITIANVSRAVYRSQFILENAISYVQKLLVIINLLNLSNGLNNITERRN